MSNGGGKEASESIYQPKKSVTPGGTFTVFWSMASAMDSRTSIEERSVDFWHGDLRWTCGPDGSKTVGFIDCIKIASDVSSEEYSYVFDCHSADLLELSRLFDEDGELREEVRNDVGGHITISESTTLYIDHVQIDKEFRGLGLGLFLVDEADRKINDDQALVVLSPVPMDSTRDSEEEEPMSADEAKAAVQKLRKYFQLLGFQALGEKFAGRYSAPRDYEYPRLEAVCSHLFD